MSVEKPEELQTTPAPQAAALTDAERAELEALRAEKERRELEALRAEKERRELEALRVEKTRAAQAEAQAAAQAEAEAAAAEDAQLVAAQQRAARKAAQQEAEQIRRIQEQRAKGRALMEPDEDDEDIKMPLGQKIVIGTVVILAVIFVVSQFIL